jgi:predicted transcriptional regulator of viral defense system
MARIGPKLFDLAGEHDGVFTASEASGAGVSAQALVMAERRGTLRRLDRGLYRLQSYPSDEARAQLWEAVLWPTTQRRIDIGRCVLSHLTALHLYEPKLVYLPSRVSITVPPTLRLRRASVPSWLEVHNELLMSEEVTNVDGLPTTTLLRTLRDCIAAGTDRRLIEQATSTGLRAGLLRSADVRNLQKT